MSRQSALREHIQRSHLQIYLQEINATALLSAAEERELAERVAEGDPEARDHMVKANLRLVVNIARNYLGKGLCLEDLIEEGNLGLLRAVEGFDGSMDTRFSTYASFWIKQSIRRAVMNNGKPIRLPAYMVTLLSKWRRASTVLADRLGRMPTDDEVGKALHLSKQKLGIVTKAIQVHNLTPHPESPEPDNPILDDVLTDDRSKTAEEMLFEADDLERILDRLERLDDRVTTVVRMRFGLPPYQPMTLREVGERLGLTRERVRQLEHQAIQDLVEAFTEELV
jgi:RNA polymerase primary sigma factor